EPVFKKFLSKNHDEEKKSFEELIDFFYKHVQKFNISSIYHYGSYEITALQRLSIKYNTKIQELDYLLRNNKFVDLYRVIKDSLLLSTNDYKLKTIEKFYNFTHDSDVASGEDSLVAFENYLETNSKEIMNEIILYNKLDCESTEKLRDWVLSIMPKNIEPFIPSLEKEISEARKETIAEEKEIIKKIDKNFEKKY
ncbi:TM0106 family RecB-like putative nuclease, partial [Chloroflexi bacterium]|nr:TM0106 family RecB-like putative nuclease [Chloroflexota bacterium]